MTCSVKNFEPMVMWGWDGPQPEKRKHERDKRKGSSGAWLAMSHESRRAEKAKEDSPQRTQRTQRKSCER